MENVDQPISLSRSGMTVCFTGRRPKDLVGYDRGGYADLMKFLTEYIDGSLYPKYTTYISGGAQGFDQLSFWAVERVKRIHYAGPPIKNLLYIPFPGQASRWNPNDVFGKEEYYRMRSYSDGVTFISSECPVSYGASVRLLMERNTMMVLHSDLCLALWPYRDDSWKDEKRKSGTANTMRYALSQGKNIRILRYTISDGKVFPVCVEEVNYW